MPQYQGVWSLQQQMQALTSGQWATDPLFDYTTLLLQADDAANSAQNNTFLDSSTNAFAITRNGNTTQGTFSPFSLQPGAWANFFDGTDDNITLNTNTVPATGQFCLEAFVYQTGRSTTTDQHIFSQYASGSSAGRWYLRFNNSTVEFTTAISGSVIGVTSVNTNTWYHICFTRDASNVVRLFVNGVLDGTSSMTGSLDASASKIASTLSGNYWQGYISNVRVTSGSIPTLYQTSSTTVGATIFTSPTVELTTSTQGATSGNVTLLTCQSNRFVDNSTASVKTLTLGGAPLVQAFSPFAPQFQYTASGTGGSGYFDGTTDYLQTPSSANLAMGSGDITAECWFYPLTSTNQQWIFDFRTSGSESTTTIYAYIGETTGIMYTGFGGFGDQSSGTPIKNAWNHVAIVRSGSGSNNVAVFLNGTRTLQLTDNTNFSTSTGVYVGRRYSAVSSQHMAGYIAATRMVKGTAVYSPSSSTLTLPTAPPTAITNTNLLLNFTNAGILDGTMKNNLETVGNAQVSTSVVKYGSGSMYFDGTGDYLTVPASQQLAFNTGDFTVECWVYLAAFAASSEQGILQISTTSGGFSTSATNSTAIAAWNSSGQGFRIYANNGATASGIIPSTNQWYHLAVVRQNGVTKLYINGSLSATVSSDTTNYTGTYLVVGGYYSTSYLLNGYIDDLRITKGIARYTQNFIPPSVALPRQ